MTSSISNEIDLLIKQVSNNNIIPESHCENVKDRYPFKCLTCNEVWETSARSIINNELKMCPYCKRSRYRHSDVVKLLKNANITLLEQFTSVKKDNKLQCNICNNIWKSTLVNLRYEAPKCPECNPVKRYTIEFIKEFLNNKDIDFLDNEYYNDKYPHQLKCRVCDREWKSAIGRIIRNDSGCERCAHIAQRYSIEEVNKICLEKRLKLLDKYENCLEFYDFLCLDCGYKDNTTFFRLKNRKYGCVKCSGNCKYTLEEAKKKCLKKNVEFTDGYYVNNTFEHNFKCLKCDYEWTGTLKYISKHGCQRCNGYRTSTIEDIKRRCNKFDVVCLTRKKKKIKEKYKFRCRKCKTTWEDTLTNFFNHHKCKNKKCREVVLFGENLVREIFERIFGYKFIKVKPDWLRNPKTNYRLELDGFCEELGIAFEYNGRQHYEIVDGFKMNKERLAKQRFIDEYKIKKCKEKGIALIVVPQIDIYLKRDKLEKFIIEHAKKFNIKI